MMLEPGTRVRVTFEGEINDRPTRGNSYQRVSIPDMPYHFHAIYPTDVVEVLAPPQPELENGAIYRHSNNGIFYQYNEERDSFRAPGVQDWIKISTTREKLVRMVPEGA